MHSKKICNENIPTRICVLLIATLLFALLTACQTTLQWVPYDGESGKVYPEANWQMALFTMNKNYLKNQFTFWMFQLSFLLIIFFFAACASQTATMATRTSVQDPIQTFKQEIEHLQKKYNIPGMSVAVLQKQQAILADGFGYADIENKIPAATDTPYNIASLTKPFAAAILMKLVEEGQLNLQDEMANLLRDTQFQYDKQTIDGYENACKEIRKASRDTTFEYAFLLKNYRCDTRRIEVKHHLTHTAQGVPGDAYRYNGFLFGFLSLVAEALGVGLSVGAGPPENRFIYDIQRFR